MMTKIEVVKGNIKTAAVNLFSRFGYEKTSVDQIAKMAQKAKASVYYHFDSKLSIYRSVMEDEFRTLRGSLEEVREKCTEGEGECLAGYLMTRMETMLNMPVYSNYMKDSIVHQATGEVIQVVKSIRKGFDEWEYRYFRNVGEKGIKAGVFTDRVYPDMFARMLINILKGLEIQFFVTEDKEAMKSTYEAMVEILIYRNPRRAVQRPPEHGPDNR